MHSRPTQLPDAKLHVALDANTTLIADIMKHVAGNLISRWTDFLTRDGEKPGLYREDEFVDTFRSRQEVLDFWERGQDGLFAALHALRPEHLANTMTNRTAAGAPPRQLGKGRAKKSRNCRLLVGRRASIVFGS